MKKGNIFWIGYSDLLTSLFLVSIILFLVFGGFAAKTKAELDDCIQKSDELSKEIALVQNIGDIQRALKRIANSDSFEPTENGMYRMRYEVDFIPGDYDFTKLKKQDLRTCQNAGIELMAVIKKLNKEFAGVELLVIIEGLAQRRDNYQDIMKSREGYVLSYQRAVGLKEYWESIGLDFSKENLNCELLAAGSGYYGKNRSKRDIDNRKFIIHLIPKLGRLNE